MWVSPWRIKWPEPSQHPQGRVLPRQPQPVCIGEKVPRYQSPHTPHLGTRSGLPCPPEHTCTHRGTSLGDHVLYDNSKQCACWQSPRATQTVPWMCSPNAHHGLGGMCFHHIRISNEAWKAQRGGGSVQDHTAVGSESGFKHGPWTPEPCSQPRCPPAPRCWRYFQFLSWLFHGGQTWPCDQLCPENVVRVTADQSQHGLEVSCIPPAVCPLP